MELFLTEICVAEQKTAYVSFFSGIGGWDLGAYWAGARFNEHYFSEIDSYASKIFKQRFPDAISLGDITKLNKNNFSKDKRYVFSGSFPCQSISGAGKREGIYGEKSSLWFEFLRLIGICKPAVVLIENVAALSIRGLDVVIAGLASEGYSACWRVISAADVGALHLRKRMWIIAYPSDPYCTYRSFEPSIIPMSFKLNKRICIGTGDSVMGLSDVRYFDYFPVGSVQDNGVFFMGQSVADKMPLGGFLAEGDVLAVPAWEGGVDVSEVLENANNNIGRCNFIGSSEEINGGGNSVIGATPPAESPRTSFEHKDVAYSDSSRRSGSDAPKTEAQAIRRSSLGCLQYSELEGAWDVKPSIQCMVNGVPWYVGSRQEVPFPVTFEKQVDHNKMLSCYGNALLPQIAWILWRRVKHIIPDCYLG